MSTSIRAHIARIAAVVAGAVLATSTAAAAATTVDELTDGIARAWAGEYELVDTLYAPDAVHTANFYDTTRSYKGPAAIRPLAAHGVVEGTGPRIDLPAAEGSARWVDFSTLGGGTVCLWEAVDGMIARQDCLVAETSGGYAAPAPAVDEVSSEVMDLMSRMNDAWGAGTDSELLADVYAPDAVHRATFLDGANVYTGPEEILRVAAYPGQVERIGPVVEFEAAEGELAWASANGLAGGSICLFHAKDGMITRHDCFVPTT
jgi:hypothetical protein